MKSIQDAGKEILSKHPCKFYVFIGEEYGIKQRYLDILSTVYARTITYEHVSDIIAMCQTKRIIPLPPTLYVVRYDEEYVKSLNDKSELQMKKLNLPGTLVLIYEDKKQSDKLEKYLPSYTTSIDKVDIKFMIKYLRQDYPNLSENVCKYICDICNTYGQANMFAKCLSTLPNSRLSTLSKSNVQSVVGYSAQSTDSLVKAGVAARDVSYLLKIIDIYEGDYNNIFYDILSTMIDLDKLKTNPYYDCEAKPYSKGWSGPDIYNMFVLTYDTLKISRSYGQVDTKELIISLISNLAFSPIPSSGRYAS